MRYLRIILMCLLATVLLFLPPSAVKAAASGDQSLFSACSQAPNSPICKEKSTTEDPAVHIINVAADIIALIAGLAAVIMIIISGLTMITSSGKEEAVANARKRIVSALIGLVIIALAWVIVRYVVDNLVS
jgi:hypothetical protein